MNHSFFAKRISASRAAGLVGGAVFASAAAIDVARAWTSAGRAPLGTAEVSQVVAGVLVAVFALSAFTLAVRARALAPICVVAFYALLAHGSSLVLGGEVIGAVYLGIVPLVIALTRVTMGDAWIPSSRARLPSAVRPVPAPAAEPAASPRIEATLA